MNISEFVNKNKVVLIIGAVVLTIIALYMLNKKREAFGSESMTSITLGGVCGILCGILLPCCCWLLLIYYVTKKAAVAAIQESDNK